MLINLSNHPSAKWEASQLEAASQYGEIVDLPFPNIPPEWSTKQVEKIAKEYLAEITTMAKRNAAKPTIHLAGESIFCFLLAQLLLKKEFRVLTSTTERVVEENGNEKKTVFQFKQFREYKMEKKKNSMNFTLINWYKEQREEDKIRCKFLIGLVLCEVSVLFLLNLLFQYNLSTVLSTLFCQGFCSLPALFGTYCCLIIWSTILLLIFILSVFYLFRIGSKAKSNNFGFSINSKTAAKLFANAIQPRVINVLYLILFIVHLSCIGSIVHPLFTEDDLGRIGLNACFFLVIFLGAYFLIYTFPRFEKKTKNGNNIFFSGISSLFFVSKDGSNINIESLNLIPLVRAFHVISTKKENIRIKRGDKVHILLTNDINEKKLSEAFEATHDAFVSSLKLKEEAVKQFNEEFNRIKSNYTEHNVLNMVRDLIRMTGRYVFFEDKNLCEIIDNIEINFTPPANYNDFNDCFRKAKITMDEYEKDDYSIIINSTPGTATTSSALTILSMESGRKLLYYSQDKSIGVEYKMQEIMENKLDFKELIEKISEELSNDND